jgi:hypothetical protein
MAAAVLVLVAMCIQAGWAGASLVAVVMVAPVFLARLLVAVAVVVTV